MCYFRRHDVLPALFVQRASQKLAIALEGRDDVEFFLAAGAYYSYETSTQQYVVVQPPVAMPPWVMVGPRPTLVSPCWALLTVG